MTPAKTAKKTKPRVESTIVKSARQALAWAKGEDVPGIRVTAVEVPSVDVRELRHRLNLTQDEFAAKFGFSKGVLRNWEQGRNSPDGAARVLLAVIDKHPQAVEDAIRVGRQKMLMTCLTLTIALGATFLGLKTLEYYIDYEEFLVPGLSFRPGDWTELTPPANPEHVQLIMLINLLKKFYVHCFYN